jgi:hypothetical protein
MTTTLTSREGLLPVTMIDVVPGNRHWPRVHSRDMSLFRVAAKDPAYDAETGWSVELAGYWFVVYRGDEVIASGGLDAAGEPEAIRHLVTLFDLVTASAGLINWDNEDLTLRKLRDPWAEQVRAAPDTPSAKLLHLVFGDVA